MVEGEGSYRVRSETLADGTVLHLGVNLDDVRESTAALQRTLVAAIPLVAILLGAIIWWFVGRAIRPVEAIRSQVAAIGPDDLDHRVPVPETDDEIAGLAHTMNGMLDRLERSARPAATPGRRRVPRAPQSAGADADRARGRPGPSRGR